MQEKKVKTWNDTGLTIIWLLLEITCFFITRKVPQLCFVVVVLIFPIWVFVSSLICMRLPFMHWTTFFFYFSEELPPDRIYHILLADENGYILYNEQDRNFVDIWLIDNPIRGMKVKEIWNEL